MLMFVMVAVVGAFRAPSGVRWSVTRRRMASDAPEAPVADAAAEPAVVADAPAADEAAAAPAAVEEPKSTDPFAQFAVGQTYTGSLVQAKQFGLFVDINKGTNVLMPRSQMSRGTFERLKRMVETKSKQQVPLEIIAVSAENKTLSGKYAVAFKDGAVVRLLARALDFTDPTVRAPQPSSPLAPLLSSSCVHGRPPPHVSTVAVTAAAQGVLGGRLQRDRGGDPRLRRVRGAGRVRRGGPGARVQAAGQDARGHDPGQSLTRACLLF